MPERPAVRRVDLSAADMTTLEAMGVVGPQPRPDQPDPPNQK